MTNEQTPKEFWIDSEDAETQDNYAGSAMFEHPRQGPPLWQTKLIHVIEYSAYEEVKEQNEKLIKMIEVLNDENKLHIKLLEKVNDWAIAGNIENYSQLCDDLEKIQEDEK